MSAQVAVEIGAGKAAAAWAGPSGLALARETFFESVLSEEMRSRALRLALGALEPPRGASGLVVYGGAALETRRLVGATKLRGQASVRDCRGALIEALRGLDPNLAALHVFPESYRVDDGSLLSDPREAFGRVLTVEAVALVAPADDVRAAVSGASACGLGPVSVVAAPYAAGLAALTPEERRSGAVVVDLGAETTGLAAFYEDRIVFAQTLAFGQTRLTAALAARLGASIAVAERLKQREAALGRVERASELIETARLDELGRLSPHAVPRSEIAAAIAPPADDILGRVAEALARAPLPPGFERAPALLVGGGARLPGLEALASAALARPVAVRWCGELAAGAGPEDAAILGAALWPACAAQEARLPAPDLRAGPDAKGAIWTRAWRWISENF